MLICLAKAVHVRYASAQDETFEEDDGIYDDFNLDEQEDLRLRGIAGDNEDAGTTDLVDDSEGMLAIEMRATANVYPPLDLPPRTPSKKVDDEPSTNH